MPGLNQTGPMGQGPMTGRRMGRCTAFGASFSQKNNAASENDKPDNQENAQERSFGFGMGRGRRGGSTGLGRQNRFRGGF